MKLLRTTLVLAALLFGSGATIVVRGPRIPAAGGGATLFVKVGDGSGSNDSGSVNSVTSSATIPAGSLVLIWLKWENTGSPTSVTETTGGGVLTALTTHDEESGNLHGKWYYRLSATGGGTGITLAWTGTVDYCRVLVANFSYGGTCTLWEGGGAGAGGTGTAMTSNAVTNSGTHRLNIAGYAGYSSAAITLRKINAVTATDAPAAQVSDTWSWWNAAALTAQTATGTRASSASWVLNLISFAAN